MNTPQRAGELANIWVATLEAHASFGEDAKASRIGDAMVLTLAFVAGVERDALERAARALDTRIAPTGTEQSDYYTGLSAGFSGARDAIRALIATPTPEVQREKHPRISHSANCNISEKLSDIYSCGSLIEGMRSAADEAEGHSHHLQAAYLRDGADQIEALHAVPDPTVALALLFQNLFHNWSDTTEKAMIVAGILSEEDAEPTPLGHEALRIAKENERG